MNLLHAPCLIKLSEPRIPFNGPFETAGSTPTDRQEEGRLHLSPAAAKFLGRSIRKSFGSACRQPLKRRDKRRKKIEPTSDVYT